MNLSGVVFRKLSSGDFEMLKCYYQCVCRHQEGDPYSALWKYGVYPTEEDLHTYLDRGEFYGMFEHGQLIAAGAVCSRPQPGYELADWKIKEGKIVSWHLISIHPDMQKTGTGSRFIRHLQTSVEYDAVHLDVVLHNDAAIRLYERNGFEDRGVLPVYYPDTGWTDYRIFEYVKEDHGQSETEI